MTTGVLDSVSEARVCLSEELRWNTTWSIGGRSAPADAFCFSRKKRVNTLYEKLQSVCVRTRVCFNPIIIRLTSSCVITSRIQSVRDKSTSTRNRAHFTEYTYRFNGRFKLFFFFSSTVIRLIIINYLDY